MGRDANDALMDLKARGGSLPKGSPGAALDALGIRPLRLDDDDRAPPFGVPDAEPPRRRMIARPYVRVEASQIPRREWLYGRHLIRKFVSVDIAKGAMGKTSLMLVGAIAMATGRNLLGLNIGRKRRKVWYINLEDPFGELQRRIEAVCIYYGIGADELDGHLFINSGRDDPLVIAETSPNGTVVLRPDVEDIIEQVLALGIDVLMVDPFVSSHEVNENDNSAIDKVVKQGWGVIADRGNCAVNLAHHIRKMGGTDADSESSRGAKALIDAARSTWVYNQMTPQEAEKAGVDNHRRYFRIHDDKGNLAPPSDKADWYHMTSVDLGNEGIDEDGELQPSDHIGVAINWQWPDPFDAITDIDVRAILRRLDEGGKYRENAQAADWVGIAIADVLGWDLDEKASRERVKTYLKTWLQNGTLETYDDLDAGRNTRKFVRPGRVRG